MWLPRAWNTALRLRAQPKIRMRFVISSAQKSGAIGNGTRRQLAAAHTWSRNPMLQMRTSHAEARDQADVQVLQSRDGETMRLRAPEMALPQKTFREKTDVQEKAMPRVRETYS